MVAQRLARLRNAEEPDLDSIVALNAVVRHTNPIDKPRLASLHRLSSHHRVAEVDRRIVGFLLAMRERTPYGDEGYDWFAVRYPKFVYIDRVAVAPEFAGRKIGTGLYRDVFAYARTCGLGAVACEYSIDPPNPPCKVFHDRFGFQEVGVRRVAGAVKLVSMQVAHP